MTTALIALLLATTDVNAADDAAPRDIFIGTMAMENGQPVLTRCDAASNRYVLRDAPGTHAVVDWVRDGRPAYGEVIAVYRETAGKPGLTVFAIEHLTPAKSCHLQDIPRIVAKSPLGPDPALVGHYYLSGVMETGSELLLRADGSFEWYISYGAVDQFAQGTWASDGEAVILTPNGPSMDTPLFTLREVEPWNAAAEDELLRRRYDEADDEVRKRCPFLANGTAFAASPAPILGQDPVPPSPEALRASAAAALQRALAARAQAEQLAREEEAQHVGDGPAPPSDRMTATEAMGAWESARWEAIDAARKAGLPDPDLADPVLPPACRLAQRKTASSIPSAQWNGGVAVRVYDMASGQGAQDVQATLHFADHSRSTIITARRGLALLPGKPPSPVVRVDLAAPYAPGRDQTFSILPTSSGIIHFTIDARQLAALPFDTLRLRIDGHALIPDMMGRGRYERQP